MRGAHCVRCARFRRRASVPALRYRERAYSAAVAAGPVSALDVVVDESPRPVSDHPSAPNCVQITLGAVVGVSMCIGGAAPIVAGHMHTNTLVSPEVSRGCPTLQIDTSEFKCPLFVFVGAGDDAPQRRTSGKARASLRD